MKTCNLVLKGGVSSGLVYARMIARLSATYRFTGLAGASAGAIGAAFAAAAEQARQHGDDDSFRRLGNHGKTLSARLPTLFRPSPPFRALLACVQHLAPGSGRADYIAALSCFAPGLAIGAVFAMMITAAVYATMGLMQWQWALPALILAGVLGSVIALLGSLASLIILAARRYNFGICDGLAITEWLHDTLQDIAGKTGVLTFGTLQESGIDLRIMTSNLSLARPFALPDTEHPLWFAPYVWRRLFPADVMAHLAEGQEKSSGLWRLPDAHDLPVIVALRMSIACPGLLEQVPVYLSQVRAPKKGLYLSDGGLSRNFPFDIFAGGTTPTFAVDLETLAQDADDTCRVWPIAAEAGWQRMPFTRLPGPLAFCWAVMRTMREGHNRAAIRQPPANIHVYRIGLKSSEGGMNLDMGPAQIEALMGYGEAAADLILETHP